MSKGFVIRIVEDAATHEKPPVILFLKSYQPDLTERGAVRLTPWLHEALKFATKEDAIACWGQQSKTNPLRPDGQPNKPLTAYSVSIDEITR